MGVYNNCIERPGSKSDTRPHKFRNQSFVSFSTEAFLMCLVSAKNLKKGHKAEYQESEKRQRSLVEYSVRNTTLYITQFKINALDISLFKFNINESRKYK